MKSSIKDIPFKRMERFRIKKNRGKEGAIYAYQLVEGDTAVPLPNGVKTISGLGEGVGVSRAYICMVYLGGGICD